MVRPDYHLEDVNRGLTLFCVMFPMAQVDAHHPFAARAVLWLPIVYHQLGPIPSSVEPLRLLTLVSQA